MEKEDIKSLSIIRTQEFPLMVECKECGSEHSYPTEVDCKVLTYELILNDGRRSEYTRDYNEPVGKFYDWIINTVLPEIEPITELERKELIHEEKRQETPRVLVKDVISKIQENKIVTGIDREDIVSCVKVEDRGQGATVDLAVGSEYRVIKVHKKGLTIPGKEGITWIIDGYDVVDDNSPSPRRLFVFPHEIVLSRKRKQGVEKGKMKVEEVLNCPTCQEPTACSLEGSTFIGQCFKCGNPVVVDRIIKNCKCGQANSLFLSGDSFQGICMKCKAALSEPYAESVNR